ncbi:MAG TPA: DNA-directed RNA polymerase subunit H [Candidatus Woesearchaeota archaeon]|nr:DNA-directed RNA polymerase subunit H [Candidatus Woesearchaeota archaeon]
MSDFDITKHILYFKHEKLTEKEKKDLLSRYDITGKELPKILEKDPALRHLKVKPGDVIRIHRKSPTAGSSDYYRVVVRE